MRRAAARDRVNSNCAPVTFGVCRPDSSRRCPVDRLSSPCVRRSRGRRPRGRVTSTTRAWAATTSNPQRGSVVTALTNVPRSNRADRAKSLRDSYRGGLRANVASSKSVVVCGMQRASAFAATNAESNVAAMNQAVDLAERCRCCATDAIVWVCQSRDGASRTRDRAVSGRRVPRAASTRVGP